MRYQVIEKTKSEEKDRGTFETKENADIIKRFLEKFSSNEVVIIEVEN